MQKNKTWLWQFGFITLIVASMAMLLYSCVSSICYNPNGCQKPTYNPSYTTNAPMTVKGISLPIGSVIYYDQELSSPKVLSKPMAEKRIDYIKFPKGSDVRWAGVPIVMLDRFFNSEMRGFSVHPDWERFKQPRNTFEKMWHKCADDLGILVKSLDDWSFNRNNIEDISSCSVVYQRGVDARGELFLDAMKKAMFSYDCTACDEVKVRFKE
ncbi:hypothetical protein [Spirabiliibacterium falconis]|uniref:hypothetical protein n=1 Tax=Spirabiliibacterium falconis TaxID=572023 RepID=UPI001AAC8C58|nr:hypothetical protein [Spirabiliibacterium falconis]MBE2895244.1 hypothetical protein [Spirabiliibacterium falconis]